MSKQTTRQWLVEKTVRAYVLQIEKKTPHFLYKNRVDMAIGWVLEPVPYDEDYDLHKRAENYILTLTQKAFTRFENEVIRKAEAKLVDVPYEIHTVYDTHNGIGDRYTVIFRFNDDTDDVYFYTMSGIPTHPHGICMYGGSFYPVVANSFPIPFAYLPKACRDVCKYIISSD